MRGRELQIALIYNLESNPPKGEPQDVIALQYTENTSQFLFEALLSLGYKTYKIAINKSLDEFRQELAAFPVESTFVFNNCDGFSGENFGSVRVIRLIESMGFKHTGSTASVISRCTNKSRAKARMLRFGIPTPPFQVFRKPRGEMHLNFPVIVKPIKEDASMGIDLNSVVQCERELWERVRYVLRKYKQPALVEEFISGRELAVSMWGNTLVESLPIAEDDYSEIADPLHCLLTYEAKWFPDSPYYQNIKARCPAPLTLEAQLCVQDTAIATFRAVGLRDFGRVDIRYYNDIPYVIDVNELPDLSPEAGFAHSIVAAGISYNEMVEGILNLAMKREGWR